eukprot:sb/3467241/
MVVRAKEKQPVSTIDPSILTTDLTIPVDLPLIVISFLSFVLHLTLLSKPDYYVLNEEHIVDWVRAILTNRFHLQPCPPLHTLILAGVTSLLGLGDEVISSATPHDTLLVLHYFRLVSALASASVPVIVYRILRQEGISLPVSIVGAVFSMCNSVLFTESRFISPTPLLVSFTLAAVLCHRRLVLLSQHHYSWLTLGALSILLGLCLSTLHYGLVPWLLIAFLTVRHEFGKFADQETPVQLLWKRFMTVVTMVTIAPLVIYLAVCGVFLGVSYRAGDSDKFLSPQFQVCPNWVIFTICTAPWPCP